MKNELGYKVYVNQLFGTYKDAFEKIETYFSSTVSDVEERETCMGDILDLFLHAQKDNKPVERVIGSDTHAFCREYVKAIHPRRDIRALFLITTAFGAGVSLVTLVMAGFGAAAGQSHPFLAPTNVFTLLCSMFIGYISGKLAHIAVRMLLFRFKRFAARTVQIFGLLIGLGFLAATFAIMIFFNPALAVPLYVPLLCGGVCMVLSVILLRLPGIRSEQTPSEPQTDHRADHLRTAILLRWRTRYDKQNHRRAKRGQPPLTDAEFIVWARGRNRLQWMNALSFGTPGALIGAVVILHIVRDGFQATDAFILAFVALITALLYGSLHRAYACSRQMIKEYEQTGRLPFDADAEDEKEETE